MSRPPPSQADFRELRHLEGELWLAKRLGELGARVHDGVTTREERVQRFREAITSQGLTEGIAGRGADKRPQTFAEAFERLFGEPLIAEKRKRA